MFDTEFPHAETRFTVSLHTSAAIFCKYLRFFEIDDTFPKQNSTQSNLLYYPKSISVDFTQNQRRTTLADLRRSRDF